MTTAWCVVLGAVVGAPLRYLTDLYLRARVGDGFPWGTLVVNVAGSALLGAVGAAAAAGAPAALTAALGTGFCGALTTFSTFGLDTATLATDGAWRLALLNVTANVGAGLLACTAAWAAVAATVH